MSSTSCTAPETEGASTSPFHIEFSPIPYVVWTPERGMVVGSRYGHKGEVTKLEPEVHVALALYWLTRYGRRRPEC